LTTDGYERFSSSIASEMATGSFKERFNAAKINIYLSQKYNILSNLTRVISL
jgi:hypothetical protein